MWAWKAEDGLNAIVEEFYKYIYTNINLYKYIYRKLVNREFWRPNELNTIKFTEWRSGVLKRKRHENVLN